MDDKRIFNEYFSTEFVAALLWVFNRAEEEGFVIDYMNDNMTFVYDSKILKVAGRNGLGIKKYYDPQYRGLLVDDEEYIQRMKEDIIPKLDQEAVDVIELLCCEYTDDYDIVGKGYLYVENRVYGNLAEIIKLINVWYKDLCKHTNTGKEYDIFNLMKYYIYGSHYDDIRHNVIDGLKKPYSLNRVKVGRIYKLMYRVLICVDELRLGDYSSIPVIVVEYLYLLLILRSNKFNHDRIYTPFATGDINQIEDRMLLELERPLVMELAYCDDDDIEDANVIIDSLFNKYTAIQL